MSIIPAIVLITGGCIALDAPIEARIVGLEVFVTSPESNIICADEDLFAGWNPSPRRDQFY